MKIDLYTILWRYSFTIAEEIERFHNNQVKVLGALGFSVEELGHYHYTHRLILDLQSVDQQKRLMYKYLVFKSWQPNPVFEFEDRGSYLQTDSVMLVEIGNTTTHWLRRLLRQYDEPVAIVDRLLVPFLDKPVFHVTRNNKRTPEFAYLSMPAYFNPQIAAVVPEGYEDLFPVVEPGTLVAVYDYGNGTTLYFCSRDKHSIKKFKAESGSDWVHAVGKPELLIHLNRRLGHHLPVRSMDKFFALLASKAYALGVET